MPEGVTVHITDRTVITAVNTPGGAIFEWRDRTADQIVRACIVASPVNNPLNAVHRGGVVGTYKAKWGWDRVGSNGHEVRMTIYNGSDHADIVEFGRRASRRIQVFSWTGFNPPGSIDEVTSTRSRDGRHILRDSTNAVIATAIR